MYEIIGVFCGLAMVASTLVNDTVLDSVSDNDFVQIETFEDYGGDIVPYVSDPYIEDNIPSDVVEEITVNQTVVDNSEVLERMDKLDSKLTLLNNSFNSVMSTGSDAFATINYSDTYNYRGSYSDGLVTFAENSRYQTFVYDVSDYDYVFLTTNTGAMNFYVYLFDSIFTISTNTDYHCEYTFFSKFEAPLLFDVSEVDMLIFSFYTGNVSTFDFKSLSSSPSQPSVPSDPSGNDPSQPSINVTYPQEVIDDVSAMQKQLVTLTGVSLLNLIIPMFVSVFKRMVDPFKKRRED